MPMTGANRSHLARRLEWSPKERDGTSHVAQHSQAPATGVRAMEKDFGGRLAAHERLSIRKHLSEIAGVYRHVDTEALDLVLMYLRLHDGSAISISSRDGGLLTRRMRPAGQRAEFVPIARDLQERLIAIFGPMRFGPDSG
jgi:hypothetical protein